MQCLGCVKVVSMHARERMGDCSSRCWRPPQHTSRGCSKEWQHVEQHVEEKSATVLPSAVEPFHITRHSVSQRWYRVVAATVAIRRNSINSSHCRGGMCSSNNLQSTSAWYLWGFVSKEHQDARATSKREQQKSVPAPLELTTSLSCLHVLSRQIRIEEHL